MRYLLTIWGPDTEPEAIPPEQLQEMLGAYREFNGALEEAGVSVGSAGLQPSRTATVVREQEGAPLMTDGPFIEAREVLGGFFLLECENLDEALAWAARVPALRYGESVEVRPVQDWQAVAQRLAAEGAAS